MGQKKVLFIMESLNIGGAEKALVSILKLLDYSAIDCTLLLISKSGDFVDELAEIKELKVRSIVEPTNNPVNRLFSAIKIKALYKLLPARMVGNYLCKDYDVVVAFCEGYLTKWVGASTVPSRKIAWLHTDMVLNDWPVKTGVFRSQEEEIETYHNFDDIVAVSQTVAGGFAEKYRCKTPRVIYNIIDQNIIQKSKESVPASNETGLKIVSVGRQEFVKGYDILIEAMDVLVNHLNLDANLCLVGDGSEKEHLLQMIEKAGLKNRVKLVGSQPNPYPYIAQADLFVCPSRREGFNISILEAMTLGKPIVACDSAGPSEILDGGKYGVLCAADSASLANAIASLVKDSSRFEQMKNLSKNRADDFSASVQIQSIENLFEE